MPEVDLEKLLKAEDERKAKASDVQTKVIGEQTLFKGKLLSAWFSDYGECVSKNQEEARRLRNKELGLDESGRTPEDVERAKRIQALLKDKEKVLEQLREIDVKISKARTEKIVIKKAEKGK